MNYGEIIDSKMTELGKKITNTGVVDVDKIKPGVKKNIDRVKLKRLMKDIKNTLVYDA